MDAMKKQNMERYAVIGLLIVFVAVLATSLKSAGLLGARRPIQPPHQPAAVEPPPISKSLPEVVKEYRQRVDPQEAEALPGSPAAAVPPHTPAYTAHSLRDPLASLLPEPPQKQRLAAAPGAARTWEDAPPAPQLSVEGFVWGGLSPKAIINGKVYQIGDEVEGALVKEISRSGVTVEFAGQPIRFTTTVESQRSELSSGMYQRR